MGQHWYRAEDGSPLYEVSKTKGEGTRPTTLRDARKLNLVPSVTTILSSISKPMLERWKQEQIIKAVLLNPFDFTKNSITEWSKEIVLQSQQEGLQAADKGREIHDALEQYYLGKEVPGKFMSHVTSTITAITNEFNNDMEWIPEASFAHKDGFGGKCDLHKKGEKPVVLDFKTKSVDDIAKVKPYTEHVMQLAAYRQGFDIPNAECYNVFINVNNPEQVLLYKWEEKEINRGWKMFQSLLQYWKLSNNFGD